MSQSVTVLSGVANSTIGGLVTVPLDIQASISGPLQTLLSNQSNAVAAGTYYLDNVNAVASLAGNYTVASNTSGLPEILEFTNTDANGAVSTGSSSFRVTNPPVPSSVSTLIVQAPGSDAIRGNGSANLLAIFGSNSQVTFNSQGGSGTIIAGGSGDLLATSGNWTVDGSTDGGDTVNANGSAVLINTYGNGSAGGSNPLNNLPNTSPSNLVGLLGGNATINAGGTDDLVEAYSNSTDLISVTGSANVLISGGVATVYAAAGSSSVEAFFETGGNLYFVNQSTVNAYVTGDVAGATGGSATVYGGAGGGTFTGGTGGQNTLIGGFAPGQSVPSAGAGLVTLTGSSSGNLLEATGSVTGGGFTKNVLIASGNSGNATLVATGTTSVNTFNAGNAVAVVVSTSGAGLQTFNMAVGGSETVTGSTAATAKNLFFFNESSVSAPSSDVITNFAFGQDTLSVTGGAVISQVTTITGGAYAGKTEIILNDGTTIKLTNLAYQSSYNTTYSGKSSFA
jgi:hypothetical protein